MNFVSGYTTSGFLWEGTGFSSLARDDLLQGCWQRGGNNDNWPFFEWLNVGVLSKIGHSKL